MQVILQNIFPTEPEIDGCINVEFWIIKIHISNRSSNSWGSSNSWDHRIVGDHRVPLDH